MSKQTVSKPAGPSADSTPAASPKVDPTVVVPGTKMTLPKLVRDQRKTELVALLMIVAGFWILGPMDKWLPAAAFAAGVLLGLLNLLATEFWLYKVISSGSELTRNKIARSTFVRLLILTAAAVGLAVAFTLPTGVGVLFGLAVFRLISLVMTTLPLLKELKKA
ncbi:MAG: hypothetical protein JWR35_437 [Marmoricola sp.]|nr:hypothetical protein [Marmoricola sp.]